MNLSRRTFIALSTAAMGCLLFELNTPAFAAGSTKPTLTLNQYLQFNADGSIVYIDTKPEMGQGSGTGIAMIVCEELGADWSKFDIEKPPLDNSIPIEFSLGSAAGSNGILAAYKPLREATALVRQMLVNAAAERLNLSPNHCYTKNGLVLNTKDKRTVSFTDIYPLLSTQSIPKAAELKSSESFYLIGQALSFRENHAIVTGSQKFSIDVDAKDMVYATIVRSPSVDSQIESFDDSTVLKVAGVAQTRLMPSFPQKFDGEASWQEKYRGTKHGVAIIANSSWAAIKAKELLNAGGQLKWSKSKYHDYDQNAVKQRIIETPDSKPRVVRASGDTLAAIDSQTADRVHRSRYFNPYQENAQMEPLNAVAKYDGENLTIWAGSQSPTQATDYVASVTGVALEKITIHSMRSGGGFGRRYFYDFIAEAAYLAVQSRKAVKLIWTREDCVQHGRYHLARLDENTLALDHNHNVLAWDTVIKSGNNYGYIGRNMIIDYYAANTPHRSTRHYESSEQVLLPGSWRSVDAHPMTLACECFVDEVAAKINTDPLELRLQWLSNKTSDKSDSAKTVLERQRLLKQVLHKVRKYSDWDKKLEKNQGKGISLSYFYGTYVSQVAYVTYHNKRVSIDKIVCVIDCGLVINPDFVKAQIQGSIIWSLSAVLNPSIKVDAGQVAQSNFHDYSVARMSDIPDIEIHLLDSDRAPNRVGEAAVPDTAPAILNAIFDVSGVRIKELPIPPAMIQAL